MKPATVALLILVNMMCTISYFDHASFLGTMAEETALLANSFGNNEGTSFMKGINLGRKQIDSTDNSHRWFPISTINGLMNNPPAHHP